MHRNILGLLSAVALVSLPQIALADGDHMRNNDAGGGAVEGAVIGGAIVGGAMGAVVGGPVVGQPCSSTTSTTTNDNSGASQHNADDKLPELTEEPSRDRSERQSPYSQFTASLVHRAQRYISRVGSPGEN